MILDSWGRYPQTISDVIEPLDTEATQRLLHAHNKSDSLIPRGAGRSYGDSALAATVLSSRFLDSFLSFDTEAGVLHCGAGVNLDTILKVAIPQGWFLPVLPGTKFVSVGGAIAADIHGKNHHKVGSFCAHIIELNLMLANGQCVVCSKNENSSLYHATCAGMGLTGIILDAKIQLLKVKGTSIKRESIVTENLDSTLDMLEKTSSSTYSVAWLDCLAKDQQLGRSIIFLGEHKEEDKLKYKSGLSFTVPFTTPSLLLNKYSMSAFNSAYYKLHKLNRKKSVASCHSFFFPLDNINHWNRLYGRSGFLQYQFVIPTDEASVAIKKILEKVSAQGKGSFLSVLKKFGQGNENFLSFPIEGVTLTLDFKRERTVFPLLNELDEIVKAHRGRVYLAKDARMSEATFKAGYPQWEAFAEIKAEYDPNNVFNSLQSKRLGLS